MKVLMQARPDIFTDKGGDTVQLLETAKALRLLGVSVEISTEFAPDLTGYDVIHLFNLKLVESTYLQMLNAKKQGKPVALSPIYWRLTEEEQKQFTKQYIEIYGKFKAIYLQCAKDMLKNADVLHPLISFFTRISKVKRYQPALFYKLRKVLGEEKMQREVLEGSDILLPNAKAEMGLILRDFGVSKDYIIVPNGARSYFENGNPDHFEKKYGLRNFVLCVARIEERKNQLYVIRALKDTGIPLVLIGKGREPYLSPCKKEGKKGVYFLGHVEGEDLANAYAAAKVHVLASWYETPGLSSLEAALAGCNIVITAKGATEEYFGNYAEYCDPASIDSIRKAIIRALSREPSDELRNIIKTKYNWKVAAERTLEAYNAILSGR
jgi:glycosyltransferase involved in cell wall biosynthesis